MIFKALMVFFFLDLNLKILRNDSACPGAYQVIQWFVSHKKCTSSYSCAPPKTLFCFKIPQVPFSCHFFPSGLKDVLMHWTRNM